jgi:hypothetical protein
MIPDDDHKKIAPLLAGLIVVVGFPDVDVSGVR